MTRSFPRWLTGTLTSVALVAAITAAIEVLSPRVPALGLGVLYLCAVVPVALVYGGAASAAVSVASMVAFDFVILTPHFSLDAGTREQWEVLLAFLVSSLVVGQLTARAQREARRARRLAEEQAALRRVATLVARRVAPPTVFAAVAREVGLLLGADAAHMGRYGLDKTAIGVAAWSAAGDHVPVGRQVDLEGESVAGLVFRTGRPARMRDYEHASGPGAALGRQRGVRSSVGAPIIVDQSLWGVIIASSKRGGWLPPDAESRIADFTELSATAIADAESRAGLARLAEEQTALRRVATLVARRGRPEEVFAAVVEEVGRLLDTDLAGMARYGGDDTVTVLATWAAEGEHPLVPGPWPLDGGDVASMVSRTGRPVRIDDYHGVTGSVAAFVRDELGIVSSAASPILVEGRLWGILFVHSMQAPQPFGDDTEERLTNFTELVATAIANAESRADLAASRARIVAATDETRRRIERDLHDGTQQRLVTLGLELRAAKATVPPHLRELEDVLAHIGEGLVSATDELREISRGIHPAILSEGGLGPALRALCRRAAVPVELELHVDRRLPEQVEVAAYYVVSEALTNAAKHARPSMVSVDLEMDDATLQLAIRDDGVGGADPGRGSGLVGLSDRIEALGGTLQVSSPSGNGTTLLIDVPLDGRR
jgi:signal transduction histidine kinase